MELPCSGGGGGGSRAPSGRGVLGGSGTIVRPERRIGGRVVPAGAPAPDDALRGAASGGMAGGRGRSGGAAAGREFVERAVAGLRGKIRTGEDMQRPARELLPGAWAADLLHGLSREEKKEAAGGYATRAVHGAPRRNMGDNLRVGSRMGIRAPIIPPSTDVAVRLLYRDNAGNEYRTGGKAVAIVYRRRGPRGRTPASRWR